MTIAIFLGSLLAAMAIGIPISFSLLLVWRRPDVASGHI